MSLRNQKVGITDTTLRDGHQSLLATRMRTEDMLPIAEKMDKMGFHSLEVWGGATFDSCMRFLNENPWERLRKLRAAFKNTKLQMLLRGQNLVGYKHYSDDVVEAFVAQAAKNGIDIFRVFDALNDVRNMRKAIEEVKKNKKHAQATISYTLGPIYTKEYYVDLGLKLKEMGADSICIKDMAGILTPYFAYDLIKELKKKVKLPIQLHTHYTSGMGAMMYLKAVEAGADVIDCANSAFAMGTSQPATETMVAVLNDAGYDTGIKLDDVTCLAEYFKGLREKYKKYDVYKAGVDVNVLRYQVPGGMLSNFINQLKEQNALDKLPEVLKEVPRVREDLGFPPLVTPSSQIVGSQAVLNVLTGERYKMVTNEVKNYFRGQYGQPPGEMNQEIKKMIIGDEKVITDRPADHIEPEMEKGRKEIGDLAKNTEEVLMYIMFPQVGKPFLEGKTVAESLEVTESPAEASKEEVNAEEAVESQGKKNCPGIGFARSKKASFRSGNLSLNFNAGIGTLNIKVNGEDFQLDMGGDTEIPKSMPKAKKTENLAPKKKASKEVIEGGHEIIAPMPGKINAVMKAQGDQVDSSAPILILEAMKMENEILAEKSGKIIEVNVKAGDSVNAGDILAIIG